MEDIDKKIIASFVIVIFLSIVYIITQPIDIEIAAEINNGFLEGPLSNVFDIPINNTDFEGKSTINVRYKGPMYIITTKMGQ